MCSVRIGKVKIVDVIFASKKAPNDTENLSFFVEFSYPSLTYYHVTTLELSGGLMGVASPTHRQVALEGYVGLSKLAQTHIFV